MRHDACSLRLQPNADYFSIRNYIINIILQRIGYCSYIVDARKCSAFYTCLLSHSHLSLFISHSIRRDLLLCIRQIPRHVYFIRLPGPHAENNYHRVDPAEAHKTVVMCRWSDETTKASPIDVITFGVHAIFLGRDGDRLKCAKSPRSAYHSHSPGARTHNARPIDRTKRPQTLKTNRPFSYRHT